MLDKQILGKRVQIFRKLSGYSQMQLETEAGFSHGVVSRIETGKINPTKETILTIAAILNLNQSHIDYLIGATAFEPSDKELNAAIESVTEYFAKKGIIAYLLDEKWKFYQFSKTFTTFLRKSEFELNKLIGRTTVEAILDPELPVIDIIHKKHYLELLDSHIPYYFSKTYYMQDDPSFIRTFNMIKKHPYTKKYADLPNQKRLHFNSQEARLVTFGVAGFKIPLRFSREPLFNYPRFEVVEFTPDSRAIQVLRKLI